ncbi:uncharacterized protein TM35_000311630 [Trypanosoma theileri]|uniref:Mucin-associated surface protein (MASP) n=1 Tax=Trypanosoma theileri TaxID=67003 RepID=A0A1X0NMR2_9TRYP|nr:uncharacterized protein TM35_000311630 [Trypanosoma theileri]ORC85977.1 hypothetical protein TM35_000311630 [Trypanosoma theileri]
MSMLSCRVFCLLAIVFCCVGVTHANYVQHTSYMYMKAQLVVHETPKRKLNCEKASKDAQEAAQNANNFATEIENNLKTLTANSTEVEQKKTEGRELIKKAEESAEKAKKEATNTVRATDTRDISAFEKERLHYELQKDKFRIMIRTFNEAIQAVKDAKKAADDAESHADDAKEAAKRVRDVIKKLEAAVSPAKEKKKDELTKQVESQPKEQTMDTFFADQQGHTEGNKTLQSQEQMQEPTITKTPPQRNAGSVTVGAHDTRGLINTGDVNGKHMVEKNYIDTEERKTSVHHHDEEGGSRQTVGQMKSGHITTKKENKPFPHQRKQTQEEGAEKTHTSVKMEELKELQTVPPHAADAYEKRTDTMEGENTSEHHQAQEKKEEEHNSTDQRPHGRSEAREMTEVLHTPPTPTQQGDLSENQTHSGRVLQQTQSLSYPRSSSDAPNIREMAANALLKSDALAKAVQQLDGSSSPALLRVPLLLLLLLSVLGCMTVC